MTSPPPCPECGAMRDGNLGTFCAVHEAAFTAAFTAELRARSGPSPEFKAGVQALYDALKPQLTASFDDYTLEREVAALLATGRSRGAEADAFDEPPLMTIARKVSSASGLTPEGIASATRLRWSPVDGIEQARNNFRDAIAAAPVGEALTDLVLKRYGSAPQREFVKLKPGEPEETPPWHGFGNWRQPPPGYRNERDSEYRVRVRVGQDGGGQ
jgi:hypothetical protein